MEACDGDVIVLGKLSGRVPLYILTLYTLKTCRELNVATAPKNYILILPAPLVLIFEPVGKWFELRDSHVTSPSHLHLDVDTEDSSDEEEEGHVNPLLLDPTQWRVSSADSSVTCVPYEVQETLLPFSYLRSTRIRTTMLCLGWAS